MVQTDHRTGIDPRRARVSCMGGLPDDVREPALT